ncbi:hypothetical protein M6D93_19280 [Jatrophihabitans telluris]|uniref:DUF916 domain-containing protein n=1 Tax=Jatrophihabitans telluris TaxID=2038343 RepID=A0ABY4QY21_9ACTN|nr:hypothetical protein [Jatrophihabitans telluris]UQX88400.1 hypothetical protein M6D93_19280 [Jatrophihabitans telluris]
MSVQPRFGRRRRVEPDPPQRCHPAPAGIRPGLPSGIPSGIRAGSIAGLVAAVLLLVSAFGASVAQAEGVPSSPAATAHTSAASNAPSAGTGTAKQNRATFGIAPITLNHQDNRTFFGYRFAANTHYDDHFALINYASRPVRLSVYSADLGNNADGSLAVGLSHGAATDAGQWIDVEHAPSVLVPAASTKAPGRVIIPFRVNIPKNAIPGDHGGAVVASLTSVGRSDGNNVKLDQRIATRVLIRVAGPLTPALSLRGLSASYLGTGNPLGTGRAAVRYTIANTGNTILGARQKVSVKGMFGSALTVPDSDTPEIPLLLPGKSVTMSFTVSNVRPAFREKLTVSLAPLVQSSDVTTPVAPVTAQTSFSAIPWSAVAIVAAIIVLAVLLWLFRRFRRRRRLSPNPPKHRPDSTGPSTPDRDLAPVA